MNDHLLRIEAVNLEHVLYDTDQLSVIRGGGLLALKGARALCDLAIAMPPESEPKQRPFWRRLLDRLGLAASVGPVPESIEGELISSGASVGLYRVSLPDTDTPRRYTQVVAKYLRDCYPHHTFAVDLEPLPTGEDGFENAHERVIARNRFRQLQQISCALPEAASQGDGTAGPCQWDDLRPAATVMARKVGGAGTMRKLSISASAKDRFDSGSGEKKKEFLRHASGIGDLDYTDDFEEIATDFEQDYRLRNKLAVLYFDGNRFGKLQSSCKRACDLKRFDTKIQGHRKRLLAEMLNQLRSDPSAFVDPGGRIEEVLRFELLLWGGDEILFVVPAWKGLDALFGFYEASSHWTWEDQALTHAGALIFCHHKTPIGRMTALARELAEWVKEHPGGRDRNLFDYLILESVDFPAEPLNRYFKARYRHLAASRRPLRPVEDGRRLIRELAALRDAETLPHGKLHEGALDLIVEPDEVALLQERLDNLDKTLNADEETAKAILELKTYLTRLLPEQEPAWQWLHLAELWDYLAPRGNKEAP